MKSNCPLLDRAICMCLNTAENGWELQDMCKREVRNLFFVAAK